MESGFDAKDRGSFETLPPEVRNIIYRLTLVSNAALGIRSLNLCEYQRQLQVQAYQGRVAFRKADNGWLRYRLCIAEGRNETSHALGETSDEPVPSMAMLSLNNLTRKEAMSIFYGLNTFSFAEMDLLVPFMLDRTAAAVKVIESFKLQFCLSENGDCSHDNRIASYNTWVWAVSDLAQFEDLHLKRLVVDVEGRCCEIHFADGTPNLESPSTRWIPALREQITGLDMLGINYACSQCTCIECSRGHATSDTIDDVEEDLWNMLAPHMLKKVDDNHYGSTLQHRRILNVGSLEQDVSSNEENESTSSASQSGSEPDREEDEEGDEGDEGDDEGEDEEEDVVVDAEKAITEVKDSEQLWVEEQTNRGI